MNWQKERFSRKQLTSESFDNDNKLTLKSFFAFCSVLFTRQNGGKTETISRQTVSGFQNAPALHLRAKTYSALSFDRVNFFNMVNLFLLSRNAFVMCFFVFVHQQNFLFWRLSNDCQIVRPALVSGPQTGRSHIINILLASFFRSVINSTDRKLG